MRIAGRGARHHGLQGLDTCILKTMRTFKPYDMDQPYLLPPNIREWLPEGHLTLFVSDVVDTLDLSRILSDYERGDGRGQNASEASNGGWTLDL